MSEELEAVVSKDGSAIITDKYKNRVELLAKELGLSPEEVVEQKLSLNRLKKMAMQRKYNAQKVDRRKKEKQKQKEKKIAMREQGIRPEKITITLLKDSTNKTPVAIDLSFDSYMNDKEFRKLMKQIHRCYSLNRKHPAPCQFYLTSCTKELFERFESVMPGFKKWDIICREESHLEVFKEFREKNALVFLSAESPNNVPEAEVLKATNGQFAYVIGGLVDHNLYKGLTKGLADENKIQHAKLPIDEYLSLSGSKVLTVNHVFELMLNTSTGLPWSEAFKQVIPQRKLHQNKRKGKKDNASS